MFNVDNHFTSTHFNTVHSEIHLFKSNLNTTVSEGHPLHVHAHKNKEKYQFKQQF